MEKRIEQVYCALGDGDANEFLQRQEEGWELHSVVGVPGTAEDWGAPGYIFVRREAEEGRAW